jgi:integrase
MPRRKTVRQRGSGSILRLPGSLNWYIFYRVNGRQIRESSHSHVKQVALALLWRRLDERDQGLAPAQEVKRLRYEDVRQALLSDYELRGRHMLYRLADGSPRIDGLPHLDKFFKGRSAASIGTQDIRQFILSRQKEGAQSGTINRNLALLRRMLNIARKEGKLPSVPYFPMLKEGPARTGFLTHEQFNKLYQALPEYVRPLVLLLYWAGCRLGESRKIEWSQVDLTRRQITLQGEQTKSSEPRILPLPDQLVELLKAAPNKKGRVFYQGEFRRSWMNACCRAGLGTRTKTKKGWYEYHGLIVHDLRRSAVRNLREAGVQESVIMRISGHKTRTIFDRYSIVSTEDLQRAMQRVQAVAQVIEVPKLLGKFDSCSTQVEPSSEANVKVSYL